MYPVQTGAVPPCQKVVTAIAGLVVLVLSVCFLWNQDAFCDLSQEQLALNVELALINAQREASETKLTETKRSYNQYVEKKRLEFKTSIKSMKDEYQEQLTKNDEKEKETARWRTYNGVLRNVFDDSSKKFTLHSAHRKNHVFFFHRVGLNEELDVRRYSTTTLIAGEGSAKGHAGQIKRLSRKDIIVWVEGASKPDAGEFLDILRKQSVLVVVRRDVRR